MRSVSTKKNKSWLTMLYNYEKKAKIWKITLYSCLQAISSGPLFKDDPPKYSEIQHWKQFWVVAEFKIDIEPTEKRRRSFQGQTWAWNICDKYSPVTFIDQHCQISAVLGEIKRYFDWHRKKLLLCVLQNQIPVFLHPSHQWPRCCTSLSFWSILKNVSIIQHSTFKSILKQHSYHHIPFFIPTEGKY